MNNNNNKKQAVEMHATEHIKHARNQKKQQQQKHNERSTLLHCGFFSRVSAVCLVFNRNLHNTKIVEVKRRELVKKNGAREAC